MGHENKPRFEDEQDRDCDEQVDVWCFPERKTAQHITAKKNGVGGGGNRGCNGRFQTGVAWTYGICQLGNDMYTVGGGGGGCSCRASRTILLCLLT